MLRDGRRVIEHDAENPILAERLHGAFDQCVRCRTGLDHHDRAVHHRREQVGVGQDHHRRRIDDDPVEGVARLVQQTPHPLGGQIRHRVGIRLPSGDERQPLRDAARGKLAVRGGGEPLAETVRVVRAEDLVQRRPAQVGVDQQHAALVRFAEREAEVCGRQRLAFTWHGAGDHHNLDSPVGLLVVQRGRQPPVLLARRHLHPHVCNNLLGKGVVYPLQQGSRGSRAAGRRHRMNSGRRMAHVDCSGGLTHGSGRGGRRPRTQAPLGHLQRKGLVRKVLHSLRLQIQRLRRVTGRVGLLRCALSRPANRLVYSTHDRTVRS